MPGWGSCLQHPPSQEGRICVSSTTSFGGATTTHRAWGFAEPQVMQLRTCVSLLQMKHLGNTKIVPGLCVGSLVKLCLGVEANVEVLLYFSAEGAGRLYILHIFSSLCLPPACHVLDKDFSQFSGSLQLFPPGKPRPSSFSVPVGGDFSVPPTPFDTLFLPFFFFSFFFLFSFSVNPFPQPLSVLFLWCHASPNPFILLPYFILPFVLSSSTSHFLKIIFVSSHWHTLFSLFSTPSFRYPFP